MTGRYDPRLIIIIRIHNDSGGRMKEVLGTPRSCDVPGDHITDATGSRVDREVISAYLGDSYIYTKGKAGNAAQAARPTSARRRSAKVFVDGGESDCAHRALLRRRFRATRDVRRDDPRWPTLQAQGGSLQTRTGQGRSQDCLRRRTVQSQLPFLSRTRSYHLPFRTAPPSPSARH